MILTKAVHLNDPIPMHYSVQKTGYYCVVTDIYTTDEYTAVVEFRNAYGELPATQIPKLPFYGGMTILYALVAVYWGFLYYQHRQDICRFLNSRKPTLADLPPVAVQNYITAILVFLVIEMLMTWGFYGQSGFPLYCRNYLANNLQTTKTTTAPTWVPRSCSLSWVY